MHLPSTGTAQNTHFIEREIIADLLRGGGKKNKVLLRTRFVASLQGCAGLIVATSAAVVLSLSRRELNAVPGLDRHNPDLLAVGKRVALPRAPAPRVDSDPVLIAQVENVPVHVFDGRRLGHDRVTL